MTLERGTARSIDLMMKQRQTVGFYHMQDRIASWPLRRLLHAIAHVRKNLNRAQPLVDVVDRHGDNQFIRAGLAQELLQFAIDGRVRADGGIRSVCSTVMRSMSFQ